MKDKKEKELLWTLFDTFFVLILCFVILLTTMLVTKNHNAAASHGYQLNILLLFGVILSLVIYLGFMLKKSLSELRSMIENYFMKAGEEENNEHRNDL